MSDKSFEPYPYQRAVKRAVDAGENVILQAPTGAGKTWAALRPFLHHIDPENPGHPQDFPLKCIYSVPMRVLANQFEQAYRKQLRDDFGHPNPDKFLAVRKQTGEYPNDPRFEAALIFATIDQTLSSFLHIPYGIGRRQANLNAGAVISSYLVFDEVHLYDPDSMLPTTLAMLRMLRETTPFILMTATFSSGLLTNLCDWFNEGTDVETVMIPNGVDEEASLKRMLAVGSQKDKARIFHYHDQDVTPDDVLALRGRRTLVICNTVDRAQEMFSALAEGFEGSDVRVLSLHSRFLPADRQGKEAEIRRVFETSQADYAVSGEPDTILVATQVVEVGLDITSDVLITDLAPAASLLQRAGRCARKPDEKGVVHVFLPHYPADYHDEEKAGQPYYLPYGIGQRGLILCENTRTALQSGAFTGRHMDFALEQDLIDAVHTPVDTEMMQELRSNENHHLTRMLNTMASAAYQEGSDLIRKSDLTRFVFLYSGDPNHDVHLPRYPWAYEGFSLYPNTLERKIEPLLEMAGDDGAGCVGWYARSLEEHERDPEFVQTDPRYVWERIWDVVDLPLGALAIALNPEFASYDDQLGLHFDTVEPGRSVEPHPAAERANHGSYSYEKETYVQHITGLMRAYSERINLPEQGFLAYPLRDEVAHAVRRLEVAKKLPPGAFDRMARLIIALHDVGKLSEGWQAWAHEWQSLQGRPLDVDYLAAHTDYDGSPEQWSLQQQMTTRRPRHAGESAKAVERIAHAECARSQPLFLAALTAVMRHHTPTVEDYTPYRLANGADEAIHEAMRVCGVDVDTSKIVDKQREPGSLNNRKVRFDTQFYDDVVLYSLLIRVLRLADQRSLS